MVNCLIRMVMFPFELSLYVLIWCGMYTLRYSKMLCKSTAGLIFVLVAIGFVTKLGYREQLTKMLIVSFALVLIPQLVEIIVDILMRILKGYQHLF